MNISEKFNEKKRLEKQNAEVARQQKVKDLSNKIISALSDNETIESIENFLVEKGAVSITDFGCLCQGGFCDWQKGLDVMLRPLIDEWGAKGVNVNPSLRLNFRVRSSGMFENKMTIEEIKSWNKSKNK